jgi:hypothetical protein
MRTWTAAGFTVLLVTGLAVQSHARFGGESTTQLAETAPQRELAPGARRPWIFSAGSALSFFSSHVNASPALAVRYYPWAERSQTRDAGRETSDSLWSRVSRLSSLSLEVGAILPLQSRREINREVRSESGQTRNAFIQSFYEVHAALVREFPLAESRWVVPEAGIGVSMMRIVNRVDWSSPTNSATARTIRSRVSPYILLGLRFPLATLGKWGDRLSFSLSASYASYSDEFRSFDRDFDLSPSGWTLRPMLEVRW